ncbi:MAG TPA: hypothetical protein VHA15_09445 [Burkholderiales bacterium]|jgi:hypothetical protein|nr:hypothetical protein [Burkholderiales bacterium]
MDPHERACVADMTEADAYADFYEAAPPALRDRFGLRVARVADAVALLAPKLPTPMFNRAMGFGLAVAATAPALEAIGAVYRAGGVSSWWLHWNPYARPGAFPDQLRARGFTEARRRAWAKMLRDAAPAPDLPTDLSIGEVADETAAVQTADAIVRVFEMPPPLAGWVACLHGRPGWRLYAVRDGAEIVGGGALFVRETRAWLGLGAVLPTHRRRGGQGALMARRIADAVALGARQLVTETGEAVGDEPNPSLGNMFRCGFERVASRLNFAAPG